MTNQNLKELIVWIASLTMTEVSSTKFLTYLQALERDIQGVEDKHISRAKSILKAEGVEKMLTHAQVIGLLKRAGWGKVDDKLISDCPHRLCDGSGTVTAVIGQRETLFACTCPLGFKNRSMMRIWSISEKGKGYTLKWAGIHSEEKVTVSPGTFISKIAEKMEM